MNSPVGLPDPIQTHCMAYVIPVAVAAALGLTANAVAAYNSNRKSGPNKITTVPYPGASVKPKSLTTMTTGGSATRVRKAKKVSLTQVVRVPSTQSGVTRNRIPRSISSSNGLIVSHCEPFQTTSLTALGVLNYTTLALIPSVFNYLTGIASNFSKFTWLKLHIYYVPSCPTSTQGECAMANFYDFQDAGGATFVQVAQMKNGISFPPWGGGPEAGKDAVVIDVDVKDFDKPRYNYITVASFNALTSSDKNNYSPVNLATATQGSTAAVSIAGRIWVDYTIRLIDPIPSAINA